MLPQEEKNQDKQDTIELRHSKIDISSTGEFPILLPLLHKMNESHIGSILENQKIETKGKLEIRKAKEFNKRFYIIMALVCLGMIIFAYNIFKDNETVINSFNSLLSHLAALIGGGFGGYGINEIRKRKK